MPLIRIFSPRGKRPENSFSLDSEPSTQTRARSCKSSAAVETANIHLQVLNFLQRGIAAVNAPGVRTPLVADGRIEKRFRSDARHFRHIHHDTINVVPGQPDTGTGLVSSGLHRRAPARNAHRLHAGIAPEYVDDGR